MKYVGKPRPTLAGPKSTHSAAARRRSCMPEESFLFEEGMRRMIPEKTSFSRAVVFYPQIKLFELQKGFHSVWGTSQAPHGRHLMSALGGIFFKKFYARCMAFSIRPHTVKKCYSIFLLYAGS